MNKRIKLALVLPFFTIYSYVAMSICFILLLPLGDTYPMDEVKKSFGDLKRDVPVAFKFVLTGKYKGMEL